MVFDAANPDASVEQRTVSTVAPQALFLLNHEFTLAQAGRLAERLLREAPSDDTARIQRAFQLLFARPATEREVRIGLEFLSTVDSPGDDKGGPSKWEQYAQVLLGTNEFMYLD